MQYSGVTHDFQSFPMTLQNAKFRACQIAFESLFSYKEIAVLSAGFAPRIAAHCGAEIDQTHKLQLKSKFVHAIKFQLSCPVGRALLELPHPLPKIVFLHFFRACIEFKVYWKMAQPSPWPPIVEGLGSSGKSSLQMSEIKRTSTATWT